MRIAGLVVSLAILTLSACGEPRLRDLRSPSDGPDEFIVAPNLPLQQPEDLNALPAPTPGGRNITDARPLQDVAAALGGRAGSPNAPVPGADAGLVNYASRQGVDPNIRAKLAKEDEAFRKRRARFANIKILPVDRYHQAYEPLSLDPSRVAAAYRRAGVKTPKSPPAER